MNYPAGLLDAGDQSGDGCKTAVSVAPGDLQGSKRPVALQRPVFAIVSCCLGGDYVFAISLASVQTARWTITSAISLINQRKVSMAIGDC